MSRNNNKNRGRTRRNTSASDNTNTTNPFVRFAAGKSATAFTTSSSSSSSYSAGWLTTKKRGRDDEQIEHDRLKALEGRKERILIKKLRNNNSSDKNNNNKKNAPTLKKTKIPPERRKPKREWQDVDGDDDDDDDAGSLDSFIVDDEEEVEYEDDDHDDSNSNDDDDDLACDDEVRERKQRNSSDSEEEKETFMVSHPKRRSKPSAALSAWKNGRITATNQIKAMNLNNNNSNGKHVKRERNTKVNSKHRMGTTLLSSSSHDNNDDHDDDDHDDDDHDDDEIIDSPQKKVPSKRRNGSPPPPPLVSRMKNTSTGETTARRRILDSRMDDGDPYKGTQRTINNNSSGVQHRHHKSREDTKNEKAKKKKKTFDWYDSPDLSSSSSDDDDEEEEEATAAKKRGDHEHDYDESEELEIINEKPRAAAAFRTNGSSYFFTGNNDGKKKKGDGNHKPRKDLKSKTTTHPENPNHAHDRDHDHDDDDVERTLSNRIRGGVFPTRDHGAMPGGGGDDGDDEDEIRVVDIRTRKQRAAVSAAADGNAIRRHAIVDESSSDDDDDDDDDDVKEAKRLSLLAQESCGSASDIDNRIGKNSDEESYVPSQNAGITEEDYIQDEDEFVALQHALRQSEKEQKKKTTTRRGKIMTTSGGGSVDVGGDDGESSTSVRSNANGGGKRLRKVKKLGGKAKKAKNQKKNKGGGRIKEREVIGLADSSSDEEGTEEELLNTSDEDEHEDEHEDGEDDDEVDCYVEEAEREAGSVLAAANALSAEVLRTMMKWTMSSSNNNNNNNNCKNDNGDVIGKNGGVVPSGMIVDGALATSTLCGTADNAGSDKENADGNASDAEVQILNGATNRIQSAEHKWISQSYMQSICPSLKLADYQLIGVNWLALLHGMTYSVNSFEGGKSNGNLKDGRTSVNGVLADEMGLGKTVQTIAFLAWLKHHNRANHTECTGAVGGDSQPSESQTSYGVDDDDVEESANDVVNIDVNDEGICIDDDEDGNNVYNEAAGQRRDEGEDIYTRPHIVVVPASVLSNWKREFQTFCPDMTVVTYHGTMAERREIQERLRKSLPNNATGGPRRIAKSRRLPLDVVLTTFSYFSSEKSDDRSFLRKFHFDYMVVDEAHCLKNPRGMRYKNMDKFMTSHRLLLTGTPVQNSPKELMSLLCFLMPLFKRRQSGDDFDENKENDGGEAMLEYFVTLESSNGPSKNSPLGENTSENAYRKLKQLLAPFVLRRKKKDVLSQIMPPKTRHVEFVPFDDVTRKVYDGILSAHVKARANITGDNDAAAQRHLFTSLRKAVNHPLLLRTRHTSEEEVEHLSEQLFLFGYFGRDVTCTKKLVRKELENFSDFDVHCAALELIEEDPSRRAVLARYTLDEGDLFCSPKFVRLRQMLPKLMEEGHRMLIFSQWTRCLDLLGCLMDSIGFRYLRLDGSTAISDRQQLIDKFNVDHSFPVFLLSTRAGGMGINLTAADTCILHDLDFNPFNDIQAEDRCHRIGQTKPVTIVKMVTENTVDADIYAMQERKAKMNAAILENQDGSAGTQSSGKMPKKNNASAKKEQQEINSMLQTAVNRFMSPMNGTEEKGTFV